VAVPGFFFCLEGNFVAWVEMFFFHSWFILSSQFCSVNLFIFLSWRVSPDISFSRRYGVAHCSHFVLPPKLQPPFSFQSLVQNFSSLISVSLFMIF